MSFDQLVQDTLGFGNEINGESWIPFGDHPLNLNDAEKSSIAPAQGRHAQTSRCVNIFYVTCKISGNKLTYGDYREYNNLCKISGNDK